MRDRRTRGGVALLALGLVVSACSDVAKRGSDLRDDLAERGVAAYAEGRWLCETEEDDGGNRRHITTRVDIGSNGRFAYYVDGVGPWVGTWSIEDLDLRVLIPWMGDGRSGYYPWTYRADADPPTRLTGRQLDSGDGQRLEVDVARDRVTIVQHDEPGQKGPNYDWDVTCTRESSNPGPIPQTMPVQAEDPD